MLPWMQRTAALVFALALAVCVFARQEGENCNLRRSLDDACEAPAIACVRVGDSPRAQCARPRAHDALCAGDDCNPGLRCSVGRCQPAVPHGGSCSSYEDCGRQGWCDVGMAGVGDGVCKPYLGKGDPCVDPMQCPKGKTCAEDGSCVSRAGLGELCRDVDFDCTMDAWCRDGVCVQLSGEGEPCSMEHHCKGSLECLYKICVERSDSGSGTVAAVAVGALAVVSPVVAMVVVKRNRAERRRRT